MPETIADLFHIEGRYLRSVNLERDFRDPKSLNGYVLTPKVNLYLKQMTAGLTPSSGQRAWRITGDYGAGKSSYALLLSRLLTSDRKQLPKQIRDELDPISVRIFRPELIPILITGSSEPLSFVLLRGLSQTLQSLTSKRPPTILLEIRQILQSAVQDVSDEKVIGLLESACSYLYTARKAKGLLIIIDELGKLLEYAALNPDRQDVFLLQKLAELAARSANNPIFLVGLLHQGFSAYADALTPFAQKEWEKVAGRFEEIIFNQPLEQTILLVSKALGLDVFRLAKSTLAEIKADLVTTLEQGWYGVAYDRHSLLENAPGIFPLHPTVLPVAVRFFSRFGQNERSLFSFLLQNDFGGLQDYARQKPMSEDFYRLHNFYDYIRSVFGHRLGVQSYRSHWNQIDSIISSYPAENVLEEQILKTVGLLNLLDEQHLLPSEDVIRLAVIGEDKNKRKQFDNALKTLHRKKQILYLRGISGGFCLWPYTSVNLEKRYEDASRAIGQQARVASDIVEYLETRALVARRHYIETGNLRHFDVKYIPVSELKSSVAVDHNVCDGQIVVALCETDQQRRVALDFAKSEALKNNSAFLLAIPRPLNTLSTMLLEARKWKWIEENTPELQHDKYAREEVSRQCQHSRRELELMIARYVGLHQFNVHTELQWYRQGKVLNIRNGRALLSYLSDLCDELYIQAPQIANELVNRRSLSSAAAAARMRLLERIFSYHSEPLLGMNPDKKPPEMSMYLSILKAGRLHREEGERWSLTEPEENDDPLNLRPVLQHIRTLLEKRRDSRIRVVDLLASLRQPPFGIRDGIGVLLLANFAVIHEPHVAFYENGVFKHRTAGLDVMHLVKVIEKYEIQYFQVAGVRATLFEEILKLLEVPGRVHPQLLDVVRPLLVFTARLPKYVRTTTHLSETAKKVRNVLLEARDPAKLLFHELPEACGFVKFEVKDHRSDIQVRKFVGILKGAIDELGSAYTELLARMKAVLCQSFDLPEDVLDFRERLAERADELIKFVVEPNLRAFCLRLCDLQLPDFEWLESLGSHMCAAAPSKWTDADEGRYIQELNAITARFRRIEGLNFEMRGKRITAHSAVRFTITKPDGTERDEVIYFNPSEEIKVADIEAKITALIHKSKGAGRAVVVRALLNILSGN